MAEVLERHGFERRFRDPQFTAQTRVVPFVHVSTSLPLDVVLAGPGLEEQFFERAQSRDQLDADYVERTLGMPADDRFTPWLPAESF